MLSSEGAFQCIVVQAGENGLNVSSTVVLLCHVKTETQSLQLMADGIVKCSLRNVHLVTAGASRLLSS